MLQTEKCLLFISLNNNSSLCVINFLSMQFLTILLTMQISVIHLCALLTYARWKKIYILPVTASTKDSNGFKAFYGYCLRLKKKSISFRQAVPYMWQWSPLLTFSVGTYVLNFFLWSDTLISWKAIVSKQEKMPWMCGLNIFWNFRTLWNRMA